MVTVGDYSRRSGRPANDRMNIIRRDLKDMTLPGKKMEKWRQTERYSVKVWPNASIRAGCVDG